MGLGTLLERLFIAISADTSGLDQDLQQATDSVKKMTKQIGHDLARVGRDVSSTGYMISAVVTAPIAAAGATLVKAAGDFQTAMIRVQQDARATNTETQRMGDLAQQLGLKWGFGAKAVAESIDDLIKNGHTINDVLNGTADATATLAKAASTDLAPAANVVTDTMNDFGISAAGMQTAVDKVVGTLLQSKFELRDYQLAIGMAGAAAHNFGVSFDDFNATLSATASAFTSGSDAGTSFKVFLTRLTGATKPAQEAMSQYNLEFFDANGNMKDMASIADMLQQNLGGLSDEARNVVLKDIFGIDALRMGAALVEKGGDAIRRLRGEISKTNATEMASAKSFGLEGALKSLSAAWQDLGIAVGDSGILDGVTMLVRGITGLVSAIGQLPAPVVALGSAFLGLVAIIGPLLALVGGAITTFGTFSELFAVGGILAEGGALASLGAILTDVGAAFVALAPPIAAAIAIATGIYLLFKEQLDPAFKAIADYAINTLGPAFDTCFKAAEQVVSSFAAMWKDFMGTGFGQGVQAVIDWLGNLLAGFVDVLGTAIVNILNAFVATFTGVFNIISNTFRLIGSLLRGDWASAWKDFKQLAGTAFTDFVNVIRALFPQAVAAVEAMVNGIKTWIETRLNAIWDAAIKKIDDLKKKFFDLYDAVVGHSYIPDMVDEIGVHMRRLGDEMVAPATQAIDAVDKRFQDLASSAVNAGESVVSEVSTIGAAVGTPANDNSKKDEEIDKNVSDAIDAVKNNLMSAFDSGKFSMKNTIHDILKSVFSNALDELADWAKGKMGDVVKQMFSGDWSKSLSSIWNGIKGIFSGGSSGGGFLSSIASAFSSIFGGFRAAGGSISSNKAYVVGEKGPEILMSRSNGHIVSNDNAFGAPSPRAITQNIDARGAILASDIFDSIRTTGQNAAMAGIQGGSMLAQQTIAKRNRRKL